MSFGPQTRWEFDVLRFACDHIKFNDGWSDEINPVGGVHIQQKPIECKVDVIEVNQLFAMCTMKDSPVSVI